MKQRPRGFVIGVVVVGLAIVGASTLIGRISGPSSGSVAEWLSALATLAAFIAAGIAARFAWHALLIEQRRDQKRLESETRSQARYVTVAAEESSWRSAEPVTTSFTPTGTVTQPVVAGHPREPARSGAQPL